MVVSLKTCHFHVMTCLSSLFTETTVITTTEDRSVAYRSESPPPEPPPSPPPPEMYGLPRYSATVPVAYPPDPKNDSYPPSDQKNDTYPPKPTPAYPQDAKYDSTANETYPTEPPPAYPPPENGEYDTHKHP